jgi:hypothetical protein
VNRVRVVVWGGVALLVIATAVILDRRPEPTYHSILDEHQDCGSGGTDDGDPDYDALERCLIERYDWPRLVAERFSDAARNHAERWEPFNQPTDWAAFQRYAADLRAVYRALGVRDLEEVEIEIYVDSTVRADSDLIDRLVRDSVDLARRIEELVGQGT